MKLNAPRGFFFCRYCGSYHFPETAPDQGVKVLADTSNLRGCPACSAPLATAQIDGAHAAHYCRSCRGVLLARGSFAEVVRLRRAWATDPPAPPTPLNREELERRLNCPVCAAEMNTYPYHGPGSIVMDACERCHVIWLDFGELKQIVDAPGSDRGRQEQRPTPDRSIGIPPGPGTGSWGRSRGRVDLLDLVRDLFDD